MVVITPSSTVNETSTFNISCSASTSDSLTYSWTKDGKSYGSSSPEITISSAKRTDTGNYVCTVTSTFGTKRSIQKKITVNCK